MQINDTGVRNMKTVYVNHKPWWIGYLLGTAAVVLLLISFSAAMLSEAHPWRKAAAVVSVIIMIMVIIAGIIIDNSETEVKCLEDKLECRLLSARWEIDLTKLDTLSYTVTGHRSRYGSWHTVDLIFRYGRDSACEEKSLEIKISSDDVGECLAGRIEKIPAMQIYRWVEELYPEKAAGYIKNRETM